MAEFLLSCSSSFLGRGAVSGKHLRLLNRHGIRCLELTIRKDFIDIADDIQFDFWKKAVANGDIVVHSAHFYLDAANGGDLSDPAEDRRRSAVAEVAARASRIRDLGGVYSVVHACESPVEVSQKGKRLVRARKSFEELAEHAREKSFRIACETQPFRSIPGNISELDMIIGACDPRFIGVCVDTNHLNLSEDLPQAIRKLGNRIYGFHFSDNDGLEERHWYPFEGVIDWPAVLKAIKDTGYRGPLNFEFGCPEDLEKDMKKRGRVFQRLMSFLEQRTQ